MEFDSGNTRTEVMFLATLAGIPATMAGWKLLDIFEAMLSSAPSDYVGGAGETLLVALLSATVGTYIGGILVLAGHLATPKPDPAYPADPMNKLAEKVIPALTGLTGHHATADPCKQAPDATQGDS